MKDKKFFDKVDGEFVNLFKEKVGVSNKIMITSHMSPDDDSVSSVLGLYSYITDYLGVDGSKISIVYTGTQVKRWEYFKNYEKVEFVDDLAKRLSDVDLLIMLDGSGWKRVSRNEKIKDFGGFTICIDHHPKPENLFDLHIVVSPYSSCSQLVYDLFFRDVKLSKDICETLLLGILGDTGNFRYVTPEISDVLGVSERLVREGEIKIEALQAKYDSIGLGSFKVLAEMMRRAGVEKVDGWPDFMFSCVDDAFIKENKVDEESLDEGSSLFSSYLKTVKGISWGFHITPNGDGTCGISLRSAPNSVSVRTVMEQMKIGGGHDRAAGGRVETNDPNEALKVLLGWMKKNKPLIN